MLNRAPLAEYATIAPCPEGRTRQRRLWMEPRSAALHPGEIRGLELLDDNPQRLPLDRLLCAADATRSGEAGEPCWRAATGRGRAAALAQEIGSSRGSAMPGTV
jgi:hypothetical protein